MKLYVYTTLTTFVQNKQQAADLFAERAVSANKDQAGEGKKKKEKNQPLFFFIPASSFFSARFFL